LSYKAKKEGLKHSSDAAWKPKPHLPHGPSGQPGSSDESCAQASTSGSATSSGTPFCSWLSCCCAPAARSAVPDGNHCSWRGCGLCCGAYTLGHAITGGFSGGSDPEPARPGITYQEPQGTQLAQHQQQPCFYEIKQFLECAQNQGDIKLCEGFSEVLKQCRLANGLA
ncbi:hypothetical protein P7K49_028825, partial [Saguinus oedipus]